ncbi:IclR family transcriptional regulator domain-containing protein [Streptomyces sp. NBC_00285]|uniref:IclR family transcriptional regulator domain-containing protein n=1 Tax=Streptomyces sp. NBC_00285 TaxID=2975700 RepID=UPI003FA73409
MTESQSGPARLVEGATALGSSTSSDARGHLVGDVESEQDVRCVAAPVRDRAGAVTAAAGVPGPARCSSSPPAP